MSYMHSAYLCGGGRGGGHISPDQMLSSLISLITPYSVIRRISNYTKLKLWVVQLKENQEK